MCSLREQEPTSIAAKMFDSKLYHVAQMCASAQRKLEIAEQEERPADVGVQIERMASCSEPDGHPPVAFENTYSLSMQSPFYGGSVQTPFSGRAPAQIFNTALLGYETSHGEPPASQQNQVSSSEVCIAVPPCFPLCRFLFFLLLHHSCKRMFTARQSRSQQVFSWPVHGSTRPTSQT